jgi:hypothetical protein
MARDISIFQYFKIPYYLVLSGTVVVIYHMVLSGTVVVVYHMVLSGTVVAIYHLHAYSHL